MCGQLRHAARCGLPPHWTNPQPSPFRLDIALTSRALRVLQPLEEFRNCDVERLGNPYQGTQTRIERTTLDLLIVRKREAVIAHHVQLRKAGSMA